MALPEWNPDRIRNKIPYVLGLTGGRRQGKSTAMADLLSRQSKDFDLVICMVGSAACNPQLEGLLERHWDVRFFFSEWDHDMMGKLLDQQEEMLAAGIKREVLLIIDDVILGSKAEDQNAHMAMRGRHFRISLAMCAVSYTTLPKRARRSLDTLLVFSCPMKGDMQCLTYEYCQNHAMARFAMNSLQDYECLVLETLEKKQSLFIWKANVVGIEETLSSQDPDESQKQDEPDSPPEHSPNDHQNKIASPSGHIESLEHPENASVSAEKLSCARPGTC